MKNYLIALEAKVNEPARIVDFELPDTTADGVGRARSS